jgi:hypothetical protein
MDSSAKLLIAWPIIKWLDDARWGRGASGSLIPGHVFARLTEPEQILTHWLTYTTDQQRPFEGVWSSGGPVFAEIVENYRNCSNKDDVMDLLCLYTQEQPDPKKKVDIFSSKIQSLGGKYLTYTPRYGSHLVSISRTLYVLMEFGKSIGSYLSNHTSFIFDLASIQDDSATARMAFLLYLLSFHKVPRGITSYHSQRGEFAKDLEIYYHLLARLLASHDELSKLYKWWMHYNRFHKRLWAAYRDYFKPGSQFESVFTRSMNFKAAKPITDFITNNRQLVLTQLELPGDLWNLAFFKYIFDGSIRNAKDLRFAYNKLRSSGMLSDQYYPEQFDISFDFAPRMCDGFQESLCPFADGLKLLQYCIGNQAGTPSERLCPINKILCGYEANCLPASCPVIAHVPVQICAGCTPKII